MSDTESARSTRSASDKESEGGDCFERSFGAVEPYVDDPIVGDDSDSSSTSSEDYEDEDRIPRQELEGRYEGNIPVSSWYVICFYVSLSKAHSALSLRCECGNCHSEYLVVAREFRCCKEISPVLGKICLIEGSELKCICEHEDFVPLTHRAVLLNAGPLLRGKDGKKYKRRGNSIESENE